MIENDFSFRVVCKKSSHVFVRCGDGEIVDCIVRGSLKFKSDDVCVGDYVAVRNGAICSVKQRKSKLRRPNVANIDAACIVIAHIPEPDYYLIDKFISNCRMDGIPCIIAVNKTDVTDEIVKVVVDEYEKAVDGIFVISAKKPETMEPFIRSITGKTVVLTGQSAVGKTSLVNAVFGTDRAVGELSAKTKRGKQTTTLCEIFSSGDTHVIDTPGFSVLDLGMQKDKIPYSYKEFEMFSDMCRFGDCKHIKEPDCAVRDAAVKGLISKSRYRRYVEIYSSAKGDNYGKKY